MWFTGKLNILEKLLILANGGDYRTATQCQQTAETTERTPFEKRQYVEHPTGYRKGFVEARKTDNGYHVRHMIPGNKGVHCTDADLDLTLNYMEGINQ